MLATQQTVSLLLDFMKLVSCRYYVMSSGTDECSGIVNKWEFGRRGLWPIFELLSHHPPEETDKKNENSEKTKFEVNTCTQCHCYSTLIIHIVGM
jgi:hypothetical protein